MEKKLEIAVIGAGVVGLSTAVCIQQKFPQSFITIFADKLGDETLSSGAAGLYRPELGFEFNTEVLRKWCKDSLEHFEDVIKSHEAGKAGVHWLSGYQLSSSEENFVPNLLLKELLPVYQKLSEKELKLFPLQFKSGAFYSTILTDCRYYLPWLTEKFLNAGGKIEVKHVSRLSELPETFNVIVNCTGFGAKALLNDHMLVPIRGQTIKVKAPWIKHFYYGDEVYITPGLDYVTLGGVKDYSVSSMKVNLYQRQYILDKCIELVPSLQNAEVINDWVGLRPFRPSLRLDANIVHCDGKHYVVVNNYGHGGHGVTLSWGTAKHATQLISEVLNSSSLLIAKL